MTNPGDSGEQSESGTTPASGAQEAPPIEQSQPQPPYPPPPADQPGSGYPPPSYPPPAYPPPPPYSSQPQYGPPPGGPAGPPTFPPPAYPGGAYPGGYGTPQPDGPNNLAVASLVASIVGLLCSIGSIVGIVLGIVALNQIKQRGQAGHGLAVAGIIVGATTLIISMIWTIYAFG